MVWNVVPAFPNVAPDQQASLGRPLLSGISPPLSLSGIGRLPLGGSTRERAVWMRVEFGGTALSGTTVVRLVSLQMSWAVGNDSHVTPQFASLYLADESKTSGRGIDARH